MINLFCDKFKECAKSTIHLETNKDYVIFTCNNCGESIKLKSAVAEKEAQ